MKGLLRKIMGLAMIMNPTANGTAENSGNNQPTPVNYTIKQGTGKYEHVYLTDKEGHIIRHVANFAKEGSNYTGLELIYGGNNYLLDMLEYFRNQPKFNVFGEDRYHVLERRVDQFYPIKHLRQTVLGLKDNNGRETYFVTPKTGDELDIFRGDRLDVVIKFKGDYTDSASTITGINSAIIETEDASSPSGGVLGYYRKDKDGKFIRDVVSPIDHYLSLLTNNNDPLRIVARVENFKTKVYGTERITK